MENITKKMLAAWLAALLLASSVTSISFADNHSDDGERMEHSDGKKNHGKNRGMKAKLQELLTEDEKEALEELHEDHEEAMEEIKEKKENWDELSEDEQEAIKADYEEMRAAHMEKVKEVLAGNAEALALHEAHAEAKWEKNHKMKSKGLAADLTDAEEAALEELREAHQEAMEAMKSEKEDMDEMTDDEKEAMKAKYEAMKATYKAEMKAILANNPEALAELEERQENKEENKDGKRMKWEGNKDWEMKEKNGHGKKRSEMTKKYKKNFAKKIGSKLDMIPDQKLEKVLWKIDVYAEKMEAREDMNEEKKDSMLAKLQALKEMIEEKLAA